MKTFTRVLIAFLGLTFGLSPFLTAQNNCLNFNGDDQYVYYGETASLNVGNITLEAWVKLDSLKPGVIIAKPGAYYLRLKD